VELGEALAGDLGDDRGGVGHGSSLEERLVTGFRLQALVARSGGGA
jgi:hypothetical protein